MARNRNEEQVRLVRIISAKATLSNVLEEIPFARVLPRDLPRCLVIRIRISVGVYVDLEILLHFEVTESENLRRVVDIGDEIGIEGELNRSRTWTKCEKSGNSTYGWCDRMRG